MRLKQQKQSSSWTRLPAILATLAVFVAPAFMVKHENFKTCDQSGFCKRNRQFADSITANKQWGSPYALDSSTIKFQNGQLEGIIIKTVAPGEAVRLPVVVSFLETGSARVTIDEEQRQKGEIELRHGSKARKERYNESSKWSIVGSLKGSRDAAIAESNGKGTTTINYGPNGKFQAVITHSPFSVTFKRDGTAQVQLNERGLLNVEHWRKNPMDVPGEDAKDPTAEASTAEEAATSSAEESTTVEAAPEASQEASGGEDTSTWWEESFGGNTDTKPRGPESIGLDIDFPGYKFVYGIPEHASSMALKQTRGGDGNYNEPYRLYNADVFEYELDSPMTLYGSVPFMQAHRKDSTVGVFWLNGAETWVDIVKSVDKANPLSLGVKDFTTTQTHWFSESGILDLFIFLGPTPGDVIKSYSELTGYTAMPQEFSMAYHQCRWNYVTDQDVKDVDRRFDKFNIPYDVIWLDIEYTDGKKYFTWDPLTFKDPEAMRKHLEKRSRKLVTIIDPHIKNTDSYPVVDELKKKDLAVHDKDGKIYDGWCWPGSSHWVDCFNPAAIEWWKSLFKYKAFVGTGPNTFIWNDMNEPSVFNGPETTMPKDNLHFDDWEHRDVHNIYGMTYQNATYQALLARSKAEEKAPRRPFVLTRAFFPGSQRYGAMWTGDNLAEWSHLAAAFPMILNQGIGGFPFAGADVGGFFGNPSKELLTRWYQSGIFYPFLRAHAHIDTRRREPYLHGEPYTGIITQALRLRYSLLPTWYTAFRQAHTSGAPIVRPNWYVHPEDEDGFALDDQLYLGNTGLLAKPVVTEGALSVDVYLADKTPYFDYFTYKKYSGKGKHTVEAPLEKIPLLMRGGRIFPRKDRARRSSALMKEDPYTLVVVLGDEGDAAGELYFDDGESFDYEKGAYVHRNFKFDRASSTLSSTDASPEKGKLYEKYAKAVHKIRVERVIVVNAPSSWKDVNKVAVKQGDEGKVKNVSVKYYNGEKGHASWALVRDPKVTITNDWSISFA